MRTWLRVPASPLRPERVTYLFKPPSLQLSCGDGDTGLVNAHTPEPSPSYTGNLLISRRRLVFNFSSYLSAP